MFPCQADRLFIQRIGVELKVIEKRRDPLDGATDQAVFNGVLLENQIEKRRQVGSIGPQELVVVEFGGFSQRRHGAGIMDMVKAPTA